MSTDSNYDYTANDNIPGVQADDGDLTQLAVATMEMRPVEEIEAENQFHDLPPGEYLLKVTKIMGVTPKQRTVTVGGRMAAYTSPHVVLQFGLPDQPNQTVQDSFFFPPADKLEQQAYTAGVVIPDNPNAKPGKPGFEANKYQQFVQRIAKDGGIRTISDFVGATVIARVQAGQPYEGRDGQMRKGYPKIQLFSYRSPSDPKPAAGPDPDPSVKSSASAPAIPTRSPLPGQQSLPLAAAVAQPAGLGAI